MTINKRFTVDDKWIKDNCIGALLNIDFNTITDANLCCDLLNQIEKEKRNNGKLTSKLLNENEQLKSTINTLTHDNTKMKKVLNTTKKENEDIKEVIKEAYNNERTKLGQSVLKQLMEAIQ